MKNSFEKFVKNVNRIKKIRLRKERQDEKLNYQKIHAREKKLSLIPVIIAPAVIVFSSFWLFAELENSKATGISIMLTALIPLVALMIYVKQSFLDFRPIKSGDYYFKTKGYEKTVIRFEVLEKLLVPFTVLFVLTTTLLGFLLYVNSLNEITIENYEKVVNFFIVWFFMIPFMIVFTLLLFRIRLRQWEDFEFHYSLGCFKIVQNLLDLPEEKQIDYFLKGINHYDYFLRNNLRIRFNKMPQIFSKIMSVDKNVRHTNLEEIISQMNEQSKLNVISCFIKMVPADDANSLFTHYSIIDILKYWAPAIAFTGTAIGILSQVVPIFLLGK